MRTAAGLANLFIAPTNQQSPRAPRDVGGIDAAEYAVGVLGDVELGRANPLDGLVDVAESRAAPLKERSVYFQHPKYLHAAEVVGERAADAAGTPKHGRR